MDDDEALVELARARHSVLEGLVAEAPAAVLRHALSASERARLPIEALAFAEEHVALAGTLEVSIEDHVGYSRTRHVLDTGAARHVLHFSSDTPGWTSGQRVQVRGVQVGDTLALDGKAVTLTAGDANALIGAVGEQRTLVILVSFRDTTTMPYSPTQAADVVFSQVDGYLRENSGGAAWLSGDVYGWYPIEMDSTTCDTTTLATMARAAAQAGGAVLANYARFVYAFPKNACAWSGTGSLGGTPSQAWINGQMTLAVVGHEIGHNLGLYHSRSLDCGASPIGTGCVVDEYGDTLDLMGATRGHYNAFQKERLGWLAPSQIVTITGNAAGTWAIEPYAASTTGVKALKILKSTDASTGLRTFYYVEQRQAIGYDAFMSPWTNVMTGIAVHTGSEAGGNTTYLLDMTPETTSWYDPALIAGRTFEDGAAGLTLQTLVAGVSGASVAVTLASPVAACTPAAPRVSISGPTGTISAGTTATYTVTVTNDDSAACAATTFTLAPTLPTNWTGTLNASTLAIAAGASASTTLRVTPPPGTATGTYQIGVRATDPANATHTGVGTAACAVAGVSSTQVTTDKPSYLRGETVAISARVVSGGDPVVGTTVTYQVRSADGRTTSATATTDASGTAVYRHRLRAKDAVGTWQASAGAAGATGTASFAVTR